MSEADATRHSRKIEPRTAPGTTLQSGRRQGAVSAMARATAVPMNGKSPAMSGCVDVHAHVHGDGADEDDHDDCDPRPVDDERRLGVLDDRRKALLRPRRGNAEHDERDGGSDVGVQDFDGRDAADPHHRRRGIADDASRAARIRGRDDGREVADADAAAKQRVRHGAADQGGGDVVEETGNHEHDREQCERAGPVVGKPGREFLRQAALLEMRGEQREADEQEEQVDEDHRLVREVGRESVDAGPCREAGDQPLVRDDGHEAGGRDRQRPAMEQRDAHERRAEDQELDRKAQRTCGQSQSAAAARQPPFSWPFQARPRTKRPGRAAVGSPFSSASTPFTMTCDTPVAYWCGSV